MQIWCGWNFLITKKGLQSRREKNITDAFSPKLCAKCYGNRGRVSRDQWWLLDSPPPRKKFLLLDQEQLVVHLFLSLGLFLCYRQIYKLVFSFTLAIKITSQTHDLHHAGQADSCAKHLHWPCTWLHFIFLQSVCLPPLFNVGHLSLFYASLEVTL